MDRKLYTKEHELDMDRIVELVEARGVFAYVEQTGGGCATIYAGEATPDPEDDRWPKYPVIAGPGWFEGPLWTKPRADSEEFSISPNRDDGYKPGEVCPVYATEEAAAEEILRVVLEEAKGEAGR